MIQASGSALRVALLADEEERSIFKSLLEDEGVKVVLEEGIRAPWPQTWNGAEVLLIGLTNEQKRSDLEGLLQNTSLPVLLNCGGIGQTEIWHKRLLGKLETLARRAVPSATLKIQRSRPELRVVEEAGTQSQEAMWVVVLGASIGGPKAVARFLQALPVSMPVVFLLVQHISEAFQDLLVEQLDRCSEWPVAMIGESQKLSPGQVWMVPADCAIRLDDSGVIRRLETVWQSSHRPDIDAVMQSAAKIFGSRCGAILFSGLGKDGTGACESISENDGFVWAQSSESCVIANMPDAVRQVCDVELSGTPEELAHALSARCRSMSASIN